MAVAVARWLTGHPTTSAFALTPDRLAQGRIWLFPTSALIVNGPPIPQIALLVLTLAVAVRRLGALMTLVVMVTAHVGATLLAYAALALFTGDADGAHNRALDYGVSAVWMGALGALWALAIVRARRRDRYATVLVIPGLAAFAIGVAAFSLLAATEHGLAFALGAATVALYGTALSRSSVGSIRRIHGVRTSFVGPMGDERST